VAIGLRRRGQRMYKFASRQHDFYDRTVLRNDQRSPLQDRTTPTWTILSPATDSPDAEPVVYAQDSYKGAVETCRLNYGRQMGAASIVIGRDAKPGVRRRKERGRRARRRLGSTNIRQGEVSTPKIWPLHREHSEGINIRAFRRRGPGVRLQSSRRIRRENDGFEHPAGRVRCSARSAEAGRSQPEGPVHDEYSRGAEYEVECRIRPSRSVHSQKPRARHRGLPGSRRGLK